MGSSPALLNAAGTWLRFILRYSSETSVGLGDTFLSQPHLIPVSCPMSHNLHYNWLLPRWLLRTWLQNTFPPTWKEKKNTWEKQGCCFLLGVMHHVHIPAKTRHLQSGHREPRERENNKVEAKASAETLLPFQRPTSLLRARTSPPRPQTRRCAIQDGE